MSVGCQPLEFRYERQLFVKAFILGLMILRTCTLLLVRLMLPILTKKDQLLFKINCHSKHMSRIRCLLASYGLECFSR